MNGLLELKPRKPVQTVIQEHGIKNPIMQKTIHVKNIEKYHPGYKDRHLIWCKTYFSMLDSDNEFEMLEEIDKWRFVSFTILELKLKKPIPADEYYLKRKGFDFKKKSLNQTLKALANFLDILGKDEDVPVEPYSGCVYFVEAGGLIKIGFSEYLDERIKALGRVTKEKITFLYAHKGNTSIETEYHKKFEKHRKLFEWYNKNKEISEFIEELKLSPNIINVTEDYNLRNATTTNPVTQNRIEYNRIDKNRIEENIIETPDWLPKTEWNQFLEMRKKIKRPPTEHAKELLIKDLENLKSKGHAPIDVLNQSIKFNWQGLFEIKRKDNNGTRKTIENSKFTGLNEKDYSAGAF